MTEMMLVMMVVMEVVMEVIYCPDLIWYPHFGSFNLSIESTYKNQLVVVLTIFITNLILSTLNILGSATYNNTPDMIALGIIPTNLPTNAPLIKIYTWVGSIMILHLEKLN